jgi:hypothetical protein
MTIKTLIANYFVRCRRNWSRRVITTEPAKMRTLTNIEAAVHLERKSPAGGNLLCTNRAACQDTKTPRDNFMDKLEDTSVRNSTAGPARMISP